MELGIELPHLGKDASPEAMTRVAQMAEDLDYGCLWAGERLLFPTRPKNGYGNVSGLAWPPSQRVVYDPLESLSYVAAKTERIRLGTSVLTALFQPPLLLAKRLATLDRLSGGRLIVGLGQGWSEDEFSATGVPVKRRGRGFEEYIDVMRRVWGPDPVRYEGRFYQIPESFIAPKPVQPNGPPLLLGFTTPAGLVRAARLADGIAPVAVTWPLLEQTLAGFRRSVQAAGRDPTPLLVMVRSNNPITPQALDESRPPLGGSLAQIRDDLQRLQALGAGHVFFGLSAHETPLDEQVRLMERLRAIA